MHVTVQSNQDDKNFQKTQVSSISSRLASISNQARAALAPQLPPPYSTTEIHVHSVSLVNYSKLRHDCNLFLLKSNS